MTRQQRHDLIAIMQTLDEERDGGPESAFYVTMGCDLEQWNTYKYALVETGLITEVGNWVTITEKGIEFVQKVNAKIAEAKAKAQVPTT